MEQMKPRYAPISVQDVTDYDPLKGTVRAKRVNFKLADGTVSYIVIPLDRYNAEEVTRELEAAASHHEDIMSIRGQVVPHNMGGNPWEQTG